MRNYEERRYKNEMCIHHKNGHHAFRTLNVYAQKLCERNLIKTAFRIWTNTCITVLSGSLVIAALRIHLKYVSCGIFVMAALRINDKYMHCALMRNPCHGRIRIRNVFTKVSWSADCCGIFVTVATRTHVENAHERTHAESWSRPLLRIDKSRIVVESLSRAQQNGSCVFMIILLSFSCVYSWFLSCFG